MWNPLTVTSTVFSQRPTLLSTYRLTKYIWLPTEMSVVHHLRSWIPQNLALDHGITHKIAESRSRSRPWRDIFSPRGARWELLEGEVTLRRKMIDKINRNQKMKSITKKKAQKSMRIKMKLRKNNLELLKKWKQFSTRWCQGRSKRRGRGGLCPPRFSPNFCGYNCFIESG